jgi:hypothetical protein
VKIDNFLGDSMAKVPQNMGVQAGGPVSSIPVPKSKGGGFSGYDPQLLQFENYSPEVKAALDTIRNSGLGMLGQPQFNQQQKPFNFQPIAQEARQGFAQQTIPSIAERFTGLGAQRSSAFGQQLGQAGAGLETNLASLGAQYGLQNRGQEAQIGLQNQQQLLQYILSLLGLGTQRTFENAYQPRQPGFAENAGLALLGAAPKAAAMYYGG